MRMVLDLLNITGVSFLLCCDKVKMKKRIAL